jgi:hypothetical protein
MGLASCCSCFIPKERDPDIQWIEGLMGFRTGLDAVVKRKIPTLAQNQTLVIHVSVQIFHGSGNYDDVILC